MHIRTLQVKESPQHIHADVDGVLSVPTVDIIYSQADKKCWCWFIAVCCNFKGAYRAKTKPSFYKKELACACKDGSCAHLAQVGWPPSYEYTEYVVLPTPPCTLHCDDIRHFMITDKLSHLFTNETTLVNISWSHRTVLYAQLKSSYSTVNREATLCSTDLIGCLHLLKICWFKWVQMLHWPFLFLTSPWGLCQFLPN